MRQAGVGLLVLIGWRKPLGGRSPRERSTARFTALLNEGGFTLTGSGQDRYGRELRVVERDGASVGAALVREGLAEEWGGVRRVWC